MTLSLSPAAHQPETGDRPQMGSFFLVALDGSAERQLVPPIHIDLARLPLALRVNVPDVTPGNYLLELRVSEMGSFLRAPLHDAFRKSVPVHIERLAAQAAALRTRLARFSRDSPALVTAQYPLDFYDRVDRGEEGLRRFARYPFGEQFAQANFILDALSAGRDPFADTRGNFRRAYRDPLDRSLQPYRLFVPGSYDGSRDFPLVVALHGSGGDENDFFDNYREAPMLPEAQRLGFLVVCPRGRGPKSGYRAAAERDVFNVLAEVRRQYRIDPGRIFLMGHSMGAFATWRLAALHPDLFAALGLIAGGGDPADAPKLRAVPQYIVHGALDEVVPVAQSRVIAAAARAAGGTVVYIELPRAGHYDAALGQFTPMFDFFSKQARPEPAVTGQE
ncbi:MAG: alpha/beta fold hydrolase [Acidobacteriia bacterium]|nr:alpha/beta fold hydrolase [Terriglobia bacterium]